MKFVIILMVVIAYVFHEVISNDYGEYNSHYSGGSQYNGGNSYHGNSPYNDESYVGDDSYGGGDESYDQDQSQNSENNQCPFTCEPAQSVWFQQSHAIPLGYYVNSGQSDHKLIPGFNYQTVNGYKFEGVLGNVFDKPDTNLAAIAEYFNTQSATTYYSTSFDSSKLNIPDENKFKLKGIAFYCYPVPFFYTIPLFEFFCESGSGSNKVSDIIVTTDFDSVATPGTAGCAFTEVLCYILPPKQTGGPYGGGAYQNGGMQSGGGYSNNYVIHGGY